MTILVTGATGNIGSRVAELSHVSGDVARSLAERR